MVAAIDVQNGWLSIHVVAFASHSRGVLVDRHEIHGSIDRVDGSAWEQAKAWVRSHPGYRGYPIDTIVVDTGFQSDIAVQAAARIGHQRTIYVKGDDGWRRPIVARSKHAKVRGLNYPLFIVGVDGVKVSLRKGFANGDMRILDTLPENVERELVSEVLLKRKIRGRTVDYWKQLDERNEALDCCAYALAAMHAVGHTSDTIAAIQPTAQRRLVRKRTSAQEIKAKLIKAGQGRFS